MIFSKRFFILLLLGSILFALSEVGAFFLRLGIFYNFILFILCFFDYILTPSFKQISSFRQYEENFSAGNRNLINITICNYSGYSIRLEIKDEPPLYFHSDKKQIVAELPAFSKKDVQYYLVPSYRGNYTFGAINLRLWSRWSLIIKQSRRFIKNDEIFVYPDITLAKKYVLFQHRNIAAPYGLRRLRFHGEGTDFESLRDYISDDDMRWIDWKASAKMRKPICKNFQIEKSQTVFILIDCGRTMTAEINQRSRLDYVVNFAASISYLAMGMEDRVGIIAFSNKIKKFLPAQRNRRHFGNIMQTLYDLNAEMIESDFKNMFNYFSLKHRRRSLILLFTELEKGQSCDILISYIHKLSKIHLPFIVTIRDPGLTDTSDAYPEDEESFFKKGIAGQLLLERERVSRDLTRKGGIILDLPPERLSLAVLNKYLEIKTKVKL